MTDGEYGLEELGDAIGHMNYIGQRRQTEIWRQTQQAKAPEILSMLRSYIPADQLENLEEFMGPGFGSEFLIEIMQHENESPLERERREAARKAKETFTEATTFDDSLPFDSGFAGGFEPCC